MANAQFDDFSLLRYQAPQWRIANYAFLQHYSSDTLMKEKGIRKVTIIQSEKKYNGKEKYNEVNVELGFDTLGYPVQEVHFDKKGNSRTVVNRTIMPDGNVTGTVLKKGGKIQQAQYWNYTESGQMLSYQVVKKGKIKFAKKVVYEGQKMQRVYWYEKDTVNYEKQYNYYYENDTGRLLLVEVLNRKGSRIHVWDYSCNPNGETNRAQAKKETRICQSKVQLPNGHRQEIWIQQHAKYIGRWIWEFDSTGRRVSENYFEGKEGEKLSRKTIWSYTDMGYQKTSSNYHHRKSDRLVREDLAVYDKDGRIQKTLRRFFGRRENPTAAWEMNFVYNGPLLVSTTAMSLIKPKSGTVVTHFIFDPALPGLE
jgi:hypothetical protein